MSHPQRKASSRERVMGNTGFKKGGFTTKDSVLPAADAEGGLELRDLAAKAPHCSLSLSPCLESLVFSLNFKTRFFFLLLLWSFFSPWV